MHAVTLEIFDMATALRLECERHQEERQRRTGDAWQ